MFILSYVIMNQGFFTKSEQLSVFSSMCQMFCAPVQPGPQKGATVRRRVPVPRVHLPRSLWTSLWWGRNTKGSTKTRRSRWRSRRKEKIGDATPRNTRRRRKSAGAAWTHHEPTLHHPDNLKKKTKKTALFTCRRFLQFTG